MQKQVKECWLQLIQQFHADYAEKWAHDTVCLLKSVTKAEVEIFVWYIVCHCMCVQSIELQWHISHSLDTIMPLKQNSDVKVLTRLQRQAASLVIHVWRLEPNVIHIFLFILIFPLKNIICHLTPLETEVFHTFLKDLALYNVISPIP